MKYYEETAKRLIVKEEVDVLVVGSGPAGIAAALSASRLGVKTMIIEQQGMLGGISTAGLMSHWAGSAKSKIYTEILTKSADRNEGEFAGKITQTIDPEKLKTIYFELLTDANVKVQLYTFASDTIVENGKVKGIITESKSGREVILANTVIDASGDGDIAAKAGVDFYKGRENDGKMQPATSMFKVGGVDYANAAFLDSFETTYETKKGELQALAKQHISHPAGHVLLYKSTLPGVVTCNMTNCINIDGTSAEDLTKAELVCRRQMSEIIEFLHEFVPGYKDCFLISSASLIGIRETRHFKGVKTLTENDILESRVFEDWIVKDAFFNFDVHNIEGAGLDKTGVQKHFPKTSGYTIPYGCLVPEKINGLILSGRNISGTHMAHSSFRVMPICMATGEAAGIATAISCKNNIEVRYVSPSDIQQHL